MFSFGLNQRWFNGGTVRFRRIFVSLAAFGLLTGLFFGCKSVPTMDKTGESLCSWPEPGAKKLSTSKETELEQKTAGTGSCNDSPWQVTSAEVPATRIGEEASKWSAQRPNGAVLFPRNFTASGPQVVLEPRSLIAQVGSEVVMVASYIGPDNDRLRCGEELEWNLDGVGRFLTGNPKNGLLYCDMTTTKKIDDRTMKTATSNRLWRIHRGTSSQEDDISILRGQSWTTIQSFQEGTSTVSILASDIDNWQNRTAGGQVHWIDASFYYPRSGIAPISQPQTLTTSVFRKSTNEPRPGWLVRYEVVSGPASGFGPNLDQEIEVMTDAAGEAKTILTQKDGTSGNSKIKIQIIRPASGTLERVVVDEKTITQSWSGNAPFDLRFSGPTQAQAGTQANYAIDVVNLTSQTQDAVVRVTIPAGIRFVSSQPPVSAMNNGTAIWVVDGIPAHSSGTIQFTGEVLASGSNDFDARVERKTSSNILDSAPTVPAAPAAQNGPSAPPRDPFGLTTDTTPPAPKTASGAQLVFTDSFPAQAAVGEEFSALVKGVPSGSDPPSAILSMIFPNDVAYLEKPSGAQHHGTEAEPLEFKSISYNIDYPVHFVAASPGMKTIQIRLLDESTRKVLSSETKTINITPAQNTPSQTPGQPPTDVPPAAPAGNSGPAASISFDVQGDNAPDFIMGRDVKFLFKIKNNVNYQLDSLVVEATPDFSHQTNPWTLVTSEPAGAAPLLDGAYRITVPSVPSGGEQTVSLTLNAKQRMDAGTFVATLQDANGSTLGEIKSAYSIQELHQTNRPAGSEENLSENPASGENSVSEPEENSIR